MKSCTNKCHLEFRKFVRLELLPVEDEPDHVLGQQREGAEVEDLIAVVIHKLQHLTTITSIHAWS